jgi:hypothetical protein
MLFDLQFSSENNPIKPGKDRQRTQKVRERERERERERDTSNVGRKEGRRLISHQLKSVSFVAIAMLRATYLTSAWSTGPSDFHFIFFKS